MGLDRTERTRREFLRARRVQDAFRALKTSVDPGKRLTRLQTLRLAISKIKALQQQLHDDDQPAVEPRGAQTDNGHRVDVRQHRPTDQRTSRRRRPSTKPPLYRLLHLLGNHSCRHSLPFRRLSLPHRRPSLPRPRPSLNDHDPTTTHTLRMNNKCQDTNTIKQNIDTLKIQEVAEKTAKELEDDNNNLFKPGGHFLKKGREPHHTFNTLHLEKLETLKSAASAAETRLERSLDGQGSPHLPLSEGKFFPGEEGQTAGAEEGEEERQRRDYEWKRCCKPSHQAGVRAQSILLTLPL
ncbi:hypothetical protein Bbelb_048750 [Branchiostoma belcheri]|nr:hypothetical protein Bbelb_048750 [Branchiostoma belcheri]